MKSSNCRIAFIALAVATTSLAAADPLPRSKVVLASAKSVDLVANTVTLPLHRGTAKGATVWYIVTDTSDAAAAAKLGILFSPLIAAAGDAIEPVAGTIDALQFTGTVDFAPARVLEVAATGAPTKAVPGSVGDADYSPVVRLGPGGPVFNAPIVAAGDAPHDIAGHTDTLDRVVAIETADAAHATVTLLLARGFAGGEPIAYVSTDASAEGPAAIERATYAPRLKKLVGGAIPIDVFFNGLNQGIAFAGRHGHLGADATVANAATLKSPLNVVATFPAPGVAAGGYSPLWDVYPAVWTKAAQAGGKTAVLRSPDAFSAAAAAGNITSPDGKPFGSAGITVDCPIVGFASRRPH
jgi:hypothetical protein